MEKDNLDSQKRVRWILEAGAVRRCHTLPHQGVYDVSQHSWNALALLYVLHPDPSRELIWALAFHDVGERFFGDQPAQVGWADKSLRSLQKQAERKALACLDVNPKLTALEAEWLDNLDRLELMLWCDQQIAFGNQHVSKCRKGLYDWFAGNLNLVPEVAIFLQKYQGWQRGDEAFSQKDDS